MIKRTCGKVDFVVAADHRVKPKEIEKRDEYQNLAREVKKNYESVVDTNLIGALSTVTKELMKKLEDWEIRISKSSSFFINSVFRQKSVDQYV